MYSEFRFQMQLCKKLGLQYYVYMSKARAKSNHANISGNSVIDALKNCNLVAGSRSSPICIVLEEETTFKSNLKSKLACRKISGPKSLTVLSPSRDNVADAGEKKNVSRKRRVLGEVEDFDIGRLPSFIPQEKKVSRRKRVSGGNFRVSLQSKIGTNIAGSAAKSYTSNLEIPRYVPPILGSNQRNVTSFNALAGVSTLSGLDLPYDSDSVPYDSNGELPQKLRNIEPHIIEQISNEIMDADPNIRLDDIAGLHHAKKCVTEMAIWPLLRPDIFKGCRSPGRGLLLFGPPGTGKTMIGKAIAGECKATFFYISPSSLASQWVGHVEKLVRALFGVARCRQPAVIFVDEIDSLLSRRKSDGEHEASRKLKMQFLIEMEGFDSKSEQILLIGATNRPQDVDEAARRRLTKRLYIPLPSAEDRALIVCNLLKKDGLFKLSKKDIDTICKLTEGYSGSDMKNLVKDASMGPLREALKKGADITKLKMEDMRPVALKDFKNALHEVRPSVSQDELGTYEEWNNKFGSSLASN